MINITLWHIVIPLAVLVMGRMGWLTRGVAPCGRIINRRKKCNKALEHLSSTCMVPTTLVVWILNSRDVKALVVNSTTHGDEAMGALFVGFLILIAVPVAAFYLYYIVSLLGGCLHGWLLSSRWMGFYECELNKAIRRYK